MGDLHDEAARKLFESASEEMRAGLLASARKVLEQQAEEKGMPPDEAITPELVDEVALGVCRRLTEDSAARLEEFVTEENLERIYEEEEFRLSPGYPKEVPEDVLGAAIAERLKLERPQAFKPVRRRRP